MKEIALVFGRLGLLGFGGPIAVMAMLEEEACRRRDWMSSRRFAEIYAILKCMPGPLATQMAIHLGWVRAGWPGGLLAGTLFVLPAFVLVLAFSVIYFQTGAVHHAKNLFSGLQAGALAIIVVSTIQLGKPYARTAKFWLIFLVSASIVFGAPRWEPLVILLIGAFGAVLAESRASGRAGSAGGAGSSLNGVFFPALFTLPVAARSIAQATVQAPIAELLWVCFKSGAFVFGTGLAIVPLLEADVVGHYGWLTHAEFMDGLAIGQVTPGPVVITATFIGYKVAGVLGATLATAAIFLPPTFNVLVLLPRILARVQGRAWMTGFSSFAIPAVVGGIAGTSVKLGAATLAAPSLSILFAVSFIAVYFARVPAWVMIPAAGAAAELVSRL